MFIFARARCTKYHCLTNPNPWPTTTTIRGTVNLYEVCPAHSGAFPFSPDATLHRALLRGGG